MEFCSRRALVAASWSAQAQDIGVGLIIPLSPPGDATGGQLIRRGAEIGVETINAKGGVLGQARSQLFVQDIRRQARAGRRRLSPPVSSEKRPSPCFGFIHSGVNIAVNEVAKEMGVPTMGTQTRRHRHHGQELRHRLPHPCRRSAARLDLDRLDS